MSSDEPLHRRRVLQLTAGIAAVGLAGCSETGTGVNETGETDPAGGTETGMTEEETDGGMTEEETTTGEETTEEETTGEGGTGQLRVVHASADAPNVDVYVNDEAVLTDVAFKTISDYLEVPAGDHQVRITAAGDESTVAFEGTVTVEADTAYTAVAYGNLTEDQFEVAVLSDEPPSLSGDQAAVSLFHASADAPAVDVVVESSGDVLFENLEFGSRADYATVPAGDYTLGVRPAGGGMTGTEGEETTEEGEDGDGESVATFDVTVESGTAYTGFAVGYLDPDAAPADESFDLVVAEDSVSSESTGTGTGTGTTTTTTA
ncbi:DUF4397 domain-containing protein [Haloarchaeobius sp. HRN-SO-5]|uniref:DUF4397 domain-containing protein n=1 Tax=Haloarchaeobius sp. HRN-SO-5 TaxID=3446118 RepID=UPI003EBB804A